MARQPKFQAPQVNPYDTMIQSTTPDQQPAAPAKTKYYRFNAKLPMECKDYLQEIAWRNRVTITEYICRLIEEDAERNQDVFQEVNQQNT